MSLEKLEYGMNFHYDPKNPYALYEFEDFMLVYKGYLPSRSELGIEGAKFNGEHLFSILKMINGNVSLSKEILFLWGSGTGLLMPIYIKISGKEFIFYPFAHGKNPNASIEKMKITDDREEVSFYKQIIID